MTKGGFPYKVISAHLVDILSTKTIINHIQSLKNFKHRKSRLFPLLKKDSNKYRVIWAETSWFFWKSDRALAPRIKMVLYHMYENCFYAVFTQSTDKIVI